MSIALFSMSVSPLKVKVSQSCLTLCNPMDYTVHGILQVRILEYGYSFQTRDRTQVFCIAGRFFTSWATREAQLWGNISQIQTEDHFTKYLTTTLQNYQGPEEQEKTEKLLQIRGDFREEHFGNPLQYSCLENLNDVLQSIGSQRVRHNWSNLACRGDLG